MKNVYVLSSKELSPLKAMSSETVVYTSRAKARKAKKKAKGSKIYQVSLKVVR